MREILRGQLDAVRLASVLQLAESEQVSGMLHIGESGKVELARGSIAAASCGPLDGSIALSTLFFVERGVFHLQEGEPDTRPAIAPLYRAILDGLRLVDEWGRIGPMMLGVAGEVPGLESPAARVIASLDGGISLARALHRAGVSPASVVDPVLLGLEQGWLTARGPPASPEPWPGPASLRAHPAQEGAHESAQARAPPPLPVEAEDYDEWMDRGRRQLRAGLFDEAEETFRRVLRSWPEDAIARQNLRHVQRVRLEEGGASPLSWLRSRT